MTFNLDALRAEVCALDYVRGTPAETAMWREDDAESRQSRHRGHGDGAGR